MKTLEDILTHLTYYRRLAQLRFFLEKNCADSTTRLEGAARYCGMSANVLNGSLKRATGLTFHQLLNRFRIKRACQLITQQNYSLLEVALECGFDSQATFIRQFKRWKRCLPSEYRKECRRIHSLGLSSVEAAPPRLRSEKNSFKGDSNIIQSTCGPRSQPAMVSLCEEL